MKYLAVISIILLSGCFFLNIAPPPSVCDQAPENSVICAVCAEMGTTPEVAHLILKDMPERVLGENDKAIALKFYQGVETFLSASVSYTALINYVQDYVDVTDTEILLISLYLPRFKSTQIISTFDRGLLLKHIEEMKGELGG